MSNVKISFIDDSTSDLPKIEEVKEWGRNDVKEFLQSRKAELDINDEVINILYDQEINGKSFLELSVHLLQNILPLGPAMSISNLINKVQEDGEGLPSLKKIEKIANTIPRMNTFPVNVEIPYIVPPKLEKDVIQLVELNYTNMIFKNFRPNDYHGMVIAGGSGIGKTRAGIEISRVLKKHPDYQPLIAAKTLYVRHVFLRQLCSPLNLPSQANTENAFYRDAKGMQSQGVDLYSDEEQEEVENLIDLNYKFFHKSKYLNHSEDNLTAGRALALGIATYYFTGRWGTTVQKKMLKIDRSFSDLTTVIKLIRRDLGAIDDRSHLIIFVQVDEFQLDPKLTVAMLRFLTEYIAEGNFTNESTVLIPIMTGTSSILIENMEGSATMYSLRHHFLSPLGKKISCELVASSAHYHAAIKSRNVMYTEVKENTNTLVSVLIDACGGVAICLIQLGYFLGSFFPGELDASENIKELWKDLVNWATTKYHKAVWEKCFLGEKNLLKWMTYVHFQWKVTRNTIINSITVGTYEHRGIIFLKGDDDDELTACFPLIFINTIASIYKLRFLEILLNPLCRLDEDSFPDFIMAKHYSGYYLLRQAGYTTVQFREIYGNFVRGSQQLLNKNITIHEDVRLFSTPIVRPKCPGEYSEFEKPQISDRKKIEVIAEGEKYKEKIIDSTSGKFIICIAKRSKTADAILPHADEQYKYVAALSSGHQLPASAVCQINMEVVLNEIKKAIGHTAFVLVSPKTFVGDIDKLPPTAAVLCGNDLFSFIGVYGGLLRFIAKSPDELEYDETKDEKE